MLLTLSNFDSHLVFLFFSLIYLSCSVKLVSMANECSESRARDAADADTRFTERLNRLEQVSALMYALDGLIRSSSSLIWK